MTVEFASAAAAALESLDAERLVDHYAPGFRFEDIPGGETITDRSALLEYFERLFSMPGIAFTVTGLRTGPETAALEWTWHGRNQRTGSQFSIRGASVFDVGPEGITRETLYYDPRPAQ